MSRPLRSMRLRTARSLSSVYGINFCPPNPGSTTDMSSPGRAAPARGPGSSAAWRDWRTRPGRQPDSRISPMVRSTCSEAFRMKADDVGSGLCEVGTMRSTGLTIRCTSMVACVCGRMAAHHRTDGQVGNVMVVHHVEVHDIRAGATTLRTSSASLEKSAEECWPRYGRAKHGDWRKSDRAAHRALSPTTKSVQSRHDAQVRSP